MAAFVLTGRLRQLHLRHPLWRRKAAQVLLALLMFALPVVFVPVALREGPTGRWVRAGLAKNTVKRILLPGGAESFRYVLVANQGIYRGWIADGGVPDWRPVDSDLPSRRGRSVEVQALAADASNPAAIYAGMGGAGSRGPAQSAGLYASVDGGQSWQNPAQALAGQEVQAIASGRDAVAAGGAGQSSQSIVCAAVVSGVYCNTGENRSWMRLDWRGAKAGVLSLAIRPGAPKIVYIGTDGLGLEITQDGGATWTQPAGDLRHRRIYDIAISAFRPDNVYLATDDGVFASEDGGATWIHLEGPTRGRGVRTIVVGNAAGDVLTSVRPAGGESAGPGAGRDGTILYAGLQHGAAYCSVDGGTEWAPLRKGMGDLTILSLAIDPQDPSVLWAGTTDGVWRYVPPTVPTAVTTPPQPATIAPTSMPSQEATAMATDTLEATFTLTRTSLPTETVTATRTPVPTVTSTLRPSATRTPQKTPTPRPSPTPTATVTLRPPTSVPSTPHALPTETRVPR